MISLSETRKINKKMREKDDSHLWPICGRFNATEIAIRRLRRWQAQGGYFDCAYSYELSLEAEISKIVNDQNL